MRTANRSTNWYVVHTHPKQEDRTSSNLNSLGIDTLSPRLRTSKRNEYTGKLTPVVKPLFPGYIFARFELDELYHKVRFTRGVHSLVCFGNRPTPVDEEAIHLVSSRMGAGGFVTAIEELKVGDEIVINDGRFQDLRGVFERELEDSERVRILLHEVSFQAHVVVDRASINKVPMAKRPSCRVDDLVEAAA
jgi:transcriptional antiterminator RfaH